MYIYIYFYFSPLIFLAEPCALWDLSSLTRDRTQALASENLGVLTTGALGEFPILVNFKT